MINYGLTSPHKTLRVWKKGKGIYPILDVDEQVKVNGKVLISDAVIIDHNLKSYKWWIGKHKNYSQREAISYLKEKAQINPDTLQRGELSGDYSYKALFSDLKGLPLNSISYIDS